MIGYYKLFDVLNRKGMKKSDLRQVLSSSTVAKLAKNEYISGEAIEKICMFLHCQPGDIMEFMIVEKIEDGYTMTTVPQLNGRDYISYTPEGEAPIYDYRLATEYATQMEKNKDEDED